MFYCLLLPDFGDFLKKFDIELGQFPSIEFKFQFATLVFYSIRSNNNTYISHSNSIDTKEIALPKDCHMRQCLRYVCGLNESMQNFCLFVQKQSRTEATVQTNDFFLATNSGSLLQNVTKQTHNKSQWGIDGRLNKMLFLTDHAFLLLFSNVFIFTAKKFKFTSHFVLMFLSP